MEPAPTVLLHERGKPAQHTRFLSYVISRVALSSSVLKILGDWTTQPTPCGVLPLLLRCVDGFQQ